jgi:hypothetical protein
MLVVSLALLKHPINLLLEIVALSAVQVAVVLKAADHDSWGDSYFMREPACCSAGEGPLSIKDSVLRHGNQPIARKGVSLSFLVAPFVLIVLKKHISFSMQQDVSCLVKKSEPEMIVGFVSQTKLHQGSVRG